MYEILRHKPKHTYESGGDYVHKLTLVLDGEQIGDAEMVYMNSPFPFYYFASINIESSLRGRGLGKKLLLQVNEFLDSRGKTGLLVNSIRRDNPAFQIYERNGWQEIEGHNDWFITCRNSTREDRKSYL